MTITLPYKSYFDKWLDLHQIFNDNIYNNLTITIDFKNVGFLEPKYIVLLASFLEPHYRLKKKFIFINEKQQVRSYLDKIDFYNYFDTSKKRISYNTSLNSSTISLWNIVESESYSYSQYAKSYFERNFIKNKDLVFIQTNLDEIFNNIFDHANSEIGGFVITQYFPNLNKIFFSVCDTGVGIPCNIKKIKPNLKDFESIEYSTVLKVTTQSTPRNRGRGLNNIITLCDDQLGDVFIYSNKGYYTTIQTIANNDKNISFRGTLINIEINLKNLQTKEHGNDTLDFYNF